MAIPKVTRPILASVLVVRSTTPNTSALAPLPPKTAVEIALFTARSISVSRPLKRLYKLARMKFVPITRRTAGGGVFGSNNQTGSGGISHFCVVDGKLLETQATPSSPIPLSIEQFILSSQAVHKQSEYVCSYALSVLRSDTYTALFADGLTNVGKHHNIARLQKPTWI
ncbi:hypothetical protein [Mesorhizobium sp. M0715]|uniref:hypothetical protein n=1 Tax=Mesorhizobium sp. M0715 TaxID=2956990 RepID=UPI00333B4DAF